MRVPSFLRRRRRNVRLRLRSGGPLFAERPPGGLAPHEREVGVVAYVLEGVVDVLVDESPPVLGEVAVEADAPRPGEVGDHGVETDLEVGDDKPVALGHESASLRSSSRVSETRFSRTRGSWR